MFGDYVMPPLPLPTPTPNAQRRMTATRPALCLVAALVLAGPLAAQSGPPSPDSAPPRNLRQALLGAQRAFASGDLEALRRALRVAHAFAPDDALVLYLLART